MKKFLQPTIIKELKKLKKGRWQILDEPKYDKIIFTYSKGINRGGSRVMFNRSELNLALSEKEVAEIVCRKIGEIPLTYSEITMVRLLE